ncbi:MAG: large subunit ribosomal protein [Patescibacteria group bacterium]|nr:large subunit ribosomal protein [Patescibacteria group bacterium]
MKSVKEKSQNAYDVMKAEFGYKNKMASPKLVKVVVSVGTGSGMKRDIKRNELVINRITKITGQKPSLKGAKQSLASFKIRQGDPVGVMVTLRGARMYAFLEKLLNISLPRTKDFRGIDRKIVDNIGNATIGIKEHTIFPETADEEIKDVFGLAITLVSTAKTKAEATKFFELVGVPFKK